MSHSSHPLRSANSGTRLGRVLVHFSMSLICLICLMCLITAKHAHAQVTCDNFAMPDINFGTFTPYTDNVTVQGTLTYTCTNHSASYWWFDGPTYYVAVCFHIGTGDSGNVQWMPRQMTAANGSILNFQIHTKNSIWGSLWGGGSLPPVEDDVLTLPPRHSRGYTFPQKGRVEFTAVISPGQASAQPGSYANSFNARTHTQVFAVAATHNNPSCAQASSDSRTVTTAPSYFPFMVSAQVAPACEVQAANTMDFGSVSALTNGPIDGDSNLSMRCTRSTPYRISLEPSGTPAPNRGTGSLRNAASNSGNADTYLNYSLFRDAARTQAWGSIQGSNTLSGIGLGGQYEDWNIYGRIHNVNVNPGTYSDDVSVRVTY